MSERLTHERFLMRISDRPLTPLYRYTKSSEKILFRCSIDNHEWSATPNSILAGHGCPMCQRKSNSEKLKGSNKIIADHGEWLEIDVSTPKFPSAVMKIDKDDWIRISSVAGRVTPSQGSPAIYAICTIRGRKEFVHRLVIQTIHEVDHANHNGLDNRRSNIREATRSQNCMNKTHDNSRASGRYGVYRQHKKWRATMKVDDKKVLDKTFDKLEDAVGARANAEKRYHGEFQYKGEPA